MRQRLIFVFLLAIFGCNKHSSNPSASLYGQWKWSRTVYGPNAITASPDSVFVLTLENPSGYQVTLNGMVLVSGAFHGRSAPGGEVLGFSNVTNNPVAVGFSLFDSSSVRIVGDTLELAPYPVSWAASFSFFVRQ
jgi:hypothetical protein